MNEHDDIFIDFIRNTLIPDLRKSGTDATADDLTRLIGIIDELSSRNEVLSQGVADVSARLKLIVKEIA